MGRDINFRLSEPADEKVTANFAVQTQNGELAVILSEVKLEINQGHNSIQNILG